MDGLLAYRELDEALGLTLGLLDASNGLLADKAKRWPQSLVG
jgi:hypothetical protein